MAIPKQTVLLGLNVRMLIGYGIHVLNLSWDQVKDLLRDLYGVEISDGEIGLILEKKSNSLEIEYERLQARIRGSTSGHLDETGWRTGSEKNYTWVMAPGESEEVYSNLACIYMRTKKELENKYKTLSTREKKRDEL